MEQLEAAVAKGFLLSPEYKKSYSEGPDSAPAATSSQSTSSTTSTTTATTTNAASATATAGGGGKGSMAKSGGSSGPNDKLALYRELLDIDIRQKDLVS